MSLLLLQHIQKMKQCLIGTAEDGTPTEFQMSMTLRILSALSGTVDVATKDELMCVHVGRSYFVHKEILCPNRMPVCLTFFGSDRLVLKCFWAVNDATVAQIVNRSSLILTLGMYTCRNFSRDMWDIFVRFKRFEICVQTAISRGGRCSEWKCYLYV